MTAAVAAAHAFVQSRLRASGWALDATAGRGWDTAFLARLLGPEGHVHACDIQPDALEATRSRWESLDCPKAVLSLHDCGHERMRERLRLAGVPCLHAVMFNLGYLPGGDHAIITRPETTRAALESLLPMLTPGGVVTVVAYPAHAGGRIERDTVLDWAGRLPGPAYRVLHLRPLNGGQNQPELVTIEVTS